MASAQSKIRKCRRKKIGSHSSPPQFGKPARVQRHNLLGPPDKSRGLRIRRRRCQSLSRHDRSFSAGVRLDPVRHRTTRDPFCPTRYVRLGPGLLPRCCYSIDPPTKSRVCCDSCRRQFPVHGGPTPQTPGRIDRTRLLRPCDRIRSAGCAGHQCVPRGAKPDPAVSASVRANRNPSIHRPRNTPRRCSASVRENLLPRPCTTATNDRTAPRFQKSSWLQ